jgi:hypothetical protein
MAVLPSSNSPIITRAAQKPPAAPGGYISISRKKLLKNLEINGEARINSWVDSMKASSPTHIKATPSLADHDQSSWIVSISIASVFSFFGFCGVGLHNEESDFVVLLLKNRFAIHQPWICLRKSLMPQRESK